MRFDRPIRVGKFRDAVRARRAIEEARASGFTRISLVAEDPNIQASFDTLCDVRGCHNPVRSTPGQISIKAALVGAGIGLVAGFAGAYLFSLFGIRTGIMEIVLPVAGVIWGAFIGVMVSRGFQGEAESFYDQDLQEGEMLVVIEDRDPARLAIAERILTGVGVAPIPLTQG